MRAERIVLATALALAPAAAGRGSGPAGDPAGDPATGFLDRSVAVEGRRYPYQVYVPRGYDPARAWPVVLFLHGSGERGDDGLRQTAVGLGEAIRQHPERWPAIVVFPQAPEGSSWRDGPARAAMAALDSTLGAFHVDGSRVYLTGISMGGRGVWYLGHRHPERFAALVPICGFVSDLGRYPPLLPEAGDDPYAAVAARVAGLPIWIFHGGADSVVPVRESRRMAAALAAAGADARYSELPGVDHGAWVPAYADEELPRWLFAQRRR